MMQFQYVVVLFGLISISLWILWAYRHKNQWLYSILPVSWIVDVLAFTIFTIIVGDNSTEHYDMLVVWSRIGRLHGIISIGVSALAMIYHPSTIFSPDELADAVEEKINGNAVLGCAGWDLQKQK